MPLVIAKKSTMEIDRASHILAQAFKDYPLSTYLFPEKKARYRHLHRFYKILVRYCLEYGEVYFDEQRNSTSLWIPAKKAAISAINFVRFGGLELNLFFGYLYIFRLFAISKWMEGVQKRFVEPDSLYLMAIAVLPGHQGNGLGSLHIKEVSKRAESKHQSCYLETFLNENVNFYQHIGFHLVCHEQKQAHLVLNAMFKHLRKPT